MAIAIGKASYGGKKTFAVKKDVPLVARILPPIGELAAKGKWAVYHAVEWGYKGADGRMKPFLDVHVENRQTKMVEVQSPAYLRRAALVKRKDELVAGLKAGTNTQEEVAKAVELVKQFNLDKKFYVNVKTISGEMGVLKINYKLKQALDAEIKVLRGKGIDPLSIENGRFFTFSSTNATNQLQDWMFTVQEYKQTVQHPELGPVEAPLVDVLTQDVIDRIEGECSELNKLYKTVTAADVQAFIEEGAVAVDRVLGTPAAPAADNTAAETKVEQRAEAVAEPAAAPIQDAAPIQGTVVQEPIVAAAVADTPAPVQEPAPVQVAAETTAAPAAVAQEAVSDEDYLKSIGAM